MKHVNFDMARDKNCVEFGHMTRKLTADSAKYGVKEQKSIYQHYCHMAFQQALLSKTPSLLRREVTKIKRAAKALRHK